MTSSSAAGMERRIYAQAMTVRSRPFHLGRQRRQDGIHIAAGAQPENRAAVVEEVKLDIASTPHELLVALGRAVSQREIPPHEFWIDVAKAAPDRLREGEVRV